MRSSSAATPFQILWTLNIGFDALYYLSGLSDWVHLSTAAACFLALARPSRPTLGFAWLLGIAGWWILSPETTNHSFTTMVGSTLALLAGAHQPGGSRTFGPVAMFLVASVYAAAILQKLNTTYLFDMEASCAVEMWRQAADAPGWLAGALPALSLVAEGAIGLGVLLPATRVPAAVFGTLFHFGLGLNPLSPVLLFSITMVALYSAAWPTGSGRLLPVGRIALLGAAAGRAVFLLSGALVGVLLVWASWLVLMGYVLHLFLRCPQDRGIRWPLRRRGLAVAAVIVPLLNTIPAHTGDRQYNSYDMYSNLLVDETGTNHLFIPSFATPQPFRERVQVVSAEPSGFDRSIRNQEQVARVELVRKLGSGAFDHVVWRDQTAEHRWERGQPLPDNGITPWQVKTRRLRSVRAAKACVDCPTCPASMSSL